MSDQLVANVYAVRRRTLFLAGARHRFRTSKASFVPLMREQMGLQG